MRRKTDESVAQVKQMLKDYGLSGFEHSYPHQLSGGMQRVALIRTLATEPDLQLLMNHFPGLSDSVGSGEDVCRILCQHQKTVIMVTHDIAVDQHMIGYRLTSRPGRVKSEHVIDFGPEYNHSSPLKRRESPRFREYFAAIWKELNSSEQ